MPAVPIRSSSDSSTPRAAHSATCGPSTQTTSGGVPLATAVKNLALPVVSLAANTALIPMSAWLSSKPFQICSQFGSGYGYQTVSTFARPAAAARSGIEVGTGVGGGPAAAVAPVAAPPVAAVGALAPPGGGVLPQAARSAAAPLMPPRVCRKARRESLFGWVIWDLHTDNFVPFDRSRKRHD